MFEVCVSDVDVGGNMWVGLGYIIVVEDRIDRSSEGEGFNGRDKEKTN